MTAPTDGEALPPQSRISSRTIGSDLIITIPRSAHASPGCAPLGLIAACAFLAVTFTAQGLLVRQAAWSLGGILFLVLSLALLAVRYARAMALPATNILTITPQSLTCATESSGNKVVQTWLRSTVKTIRAEAQSLNLWVTGQDAPVVVLAGCEAAELRFIASQLRRKWNLADISNAAGNHDPTAGL